MKQLLIEILVAASVAGWLVLAGWLGCAACAGVAEGAAPVVTSIGLQAGSVVVGVDVPAGFRHNNKG